MSDDRKHGTGADSLPSDRTPVPSGAADEAVTLRGTAGSPATVDIAHIAHELRTPLSAIAALAEIIRDERFGPLDNPRYRAYAADIHATAAHANAVLTALLDPSPAASGQGIGLPGPHDRTELDLAAVAADTVSALAPLAAQSGVTLRLVTATPAPVSRVIANRRSVRQILDNLIANALRFTPPGGEVVVSLSSAATGAVTLEVADTGDGMSDDELLLAHPTDSNRPAARLRAGRKPIGLAMVRSLATADGATLELKSTPGKGTRARIVYPDPSQVSG